jgi:type VI secretion system protein ImpH
MAGEDRWTDGDLTDAGATSDDGEAAGPLEPEAFDPRLAELHAALEKAPWRYHLYQAMRRLEAAHPQRPRFGRSRRAHEDPVRFGQEPSMAFAPSTLAGFSTGKSGVPRLDTFFLGVFGPNGPLPLHLTEYARDRARNSGDETFRRFADVFHHRIVTLFYRAWADAQPAVQYDRPGDDRYALYLGALCGHGLESLRGRDALPDHARLHWAGILAGPTRNAEGLERLLAGFFGMPVRLLQNVGHWITLPPEMLSRLGGAQCALGGSATLGDRVWDCAGKFRIEFGPVGYDDFTRMLPGSPSLDRLVAVVRSWVGDELWWDVNVVVKQDEVPATRLNARCGLGWTTWMLSGKATRDAREYCLDPVGIAG